MKIRILLFFLFVAAGGIESRALPYLVNNDFIPDAFPAAVKNETFSIPVSPDELMVVHPPLSEARVSSLRAVLREKTGADIPFASPDDITDADLASKHLIVIGGISNNRCVLALYQRRFAFADAYFPGPGGVIVHPAQSVWNSDRRIIVIGVSRDEDIEKGFTAFTEMLTTGAETIGPLHLLDTSLNLPKAPVSVQSTLDAALENASTSMAPYWTIANWGLLYYLTGDATWAEHYRDGMRMCYERARTNGRWVTESWTNLYFNLWKLVYVWELIDDDPLFSPDDRKLIEETLWGYTRFVRWLPNLDPDNAPLYECRQNHTTFLGLSLYYSHRYFTEKYGVEGLETMMDKVRRCFDDGQEYSYRPNDDAGNYLYLSPVHMLTYDLSKGRDNYFTSGRFRTLADLVVTTIDNRRDPVSFGDVGGYSHRGKGSPRGRELQFLGMGAWYYGDGQLQWLYDWGSNDRVISLDTMKEDESKEENPIQMHFGADRVFSVEDMYTGVYAVNIDPEKPYRYVGVFPVLLDEGGLRWSARRTYNPGHLPRGSERYVDKISYRWSFNPNDEYMLLDGLSTFAHGHLDGNTISRLTWKDRIWLFDLDYIKHTPKYHNGVTVTRNGIQDDPPPLVILDCAADFEKFGVTRTRLRDYNGADWTRNIVWRKGRYFVVLDRIEVKESGDYRLDSRWRTRGDVSLKENLVTVNQGDASFFIKSADSSGKRLVTEPDGSRSRWNYPYGDGEITVCHSRADIAMSPGDTWTFAALMYAIGGKEELPRELNRIGDDLYIVEDSENQELIGLSPDVLYEEGMSTDCALFVQDLRSIWLMNTTFIEFGGAYVRAPGPVTLELNYREKTGRLIVPEGSTGTFEIRGLAFSNLGGGGNKRNQSVSLGSGAYQFEFDFSFRSDVWKHRVPFISLKTGAEAISQGPEAPVEMPFGIDETAKHETKSGIDAVCSDGGSVIAALTDGTVVRFGEEADARETLFTLPDNRRVNSLHASDIDGDGVSEIIIGDNDENMYCYDMNGTLRWSKKLVKYYGTDANVTDIITADVDGSGKIVVLAATAGWKLYAFEADGTVRWESFTYYHPQTKAGVFRRADDSRYIAVGTEYHTPLNIISPKDGHVIWHVWEEMGSEYISTTDYCGFHLTDMVSVPDGSGNPQIVFGTKYNRIYSLDPDNGATRWEANTGGEVTVMDTVRKNGKPGIVAGTDAGDVVILSADGERTGRLSLGNGVTDIAVLPTGDGMRSEMIAGTEDGRVIVLDDSLTVRGVYTTEGKAIRRIFPGTGESSVYTIRIVTADDVRVVHYRPYHLKKSRHY